MMNIGEVNGLEGEISLAGVGAIVAMFMNWKLSRRREETPSGAPMWSLRGDLSYQKDSLLANERWTKVIKIKLWDGTWMEAKPLDGESMRIVENRLVLEKVELCPAQPPRR